MEGRTVELAELMFTDGAFRTRDQNPDGLGWVLRKDRGKPDPPRAPVYIDLRAFVRNPPSRRLTADVVIKLCEERGLRPNRVVDIPHSISPLVTTISDLTGIPIVTVRLATKEHGTGGDVLGEFEPGDVALVLDDVITDAGSKVEATDILRRNKLVVKDVGVVVDREQGGLQQLEQMGIRLHSVFTLLGLIDFYRETGLVKPEMADEIRVSLAAA